MTNIASTSASVHKHVQPQSQSYDNTRLPFWGYKMPKEFKHLQQIFTNKITNLTIERNCYRDLLKVAIYSIEDNEPKYETFETIAKQNNINNVNSLINVYVGLLLLLKYALKQTNIKQDIIKDDLKDHLKFPIEFANDFASLIYSQKRETIDRCLFESRPRYNTLKKLDWRIDVSISTSSLSRTLEPSVVVKMQLSDGTIHSFEICMKKFHLLRFNIASILKEIDDLENRQIFRLYE